MKRKFRVLINGKNFILDLGEGPKESGFFTTRYVEAKDAHEAENKVVELIKNDEHLKQNVFNEKNNPPILYAEEIVELESFDGISVPGGGYTFYIEGQG
jgi:hypothetical protein